ncbi:hypothetical protein C0993_012590 [Termitomyces sp. T159_Od127]|nr:hypothetical protein C0993_012590 [Termitomyces sp. T159_Od127]
MLSQPSPGKTRLELGRCSKPQEQSLAKYYRRRPRRLQEDYSPQPRRLNRSKWLHLQRPSRHSAKRRHVHSTHIFALSFSDDTRLGSQTATAVAHAKEGRGLIRINGSPINLVQPEILRMKVYEPILVAGEDSFNVLDIRVRVKGGGHTSQVYAIRQAIAKALVAYYTKYIDAYSALELKKKLVAYDRTLLIADPRRMEPKKFGGAGARARRQKSLFDSSSISYKDRCQVPTPLIALDLMDSPCASQLQEVPQIFKDEASPWRIFVSANGINGRPKLVRTLKRAGALICSDPKQANVILVDATSDTGREFIRDWGGDTDKVVLQHTWVSACLAASKVLAKDDEWGGCLTFDDGLPIVKEGIEDSVNPLPTPRITPMEVSSSASRQPAPTAVPNVPIASQPAPTSPNVVVSQPASTTIPNVPIGSQPSLQDAVSNDSSHAYPHNNAFASQQMYQQALMMHPAFLAQMQQQTFAQPNLMSAFQHPSSGPNGPLTPYSAGMGSFNYDMYNMHPLYATLNRNMMFAQDSPVPSTEYAERYVKVLLQRDHQMSNSAIGKALYRKMDNHSLGSWRSFLTQEPFKSVIDGTRKTAGIEFRKQHARAELLAREVEIVAQFFATGAGRLSPDEDDGNDAVAWERLTQQTKCQTCTSWTDWYSDHHAEVEKRYQELLAST